MPYLLYLKSGKIWNCRPLQIIGGALRVTYIICIFFPVLQIHTYGKNLTEAYDYIDKADLPDEYLPDDYTGPSRGPVKDVIGIVLMFYWIY